MVEMSRPKRAATSAVVIESIHGNALSTSASQQSSPKGSGHLLSTGCGYCILLCMAAQTTADRLLDTLGARLYAARRHAQLTPPQMAETLGVHRNNISRWESDRGLPTLPVLRQWAEVCDVSAGWLVDGADNTR